MVKKLVSVLFTYSTNKQHICWVFASHGSGPMRPDNEKDSQDPCPWRAYITVDNKEISHFTFKTVSGGGKKMNKVIDSNWRGGSIEAELISTRWSEVVTLRSRDEATDGETAGDYLQMLQGWLGRGALVLCWFRSEARTNMSGRDGGFIEISLEKNFPT